MEKILGRKCGEQQTRLNKMNTNTLCIHSRFKIWWKGRDVKRTKGRTIKMQIQISYKYVHTYRDKERTNEWVSERVNENDTASFRIKNKKQQKQQHQRKNMNTTAAIPGYSDFICVHNSITVEAEAVTFGWWCDKFHAFRRKTQRMRSHFLI